MGVYYVITERFRQTIPYLVKYYSGKLYPDDKGRILRQGETDYTLGYLIISYQLEKRNIIKVYEDTLLGGE